MGEDDDQGNPSHRFAPQERRRAGVGPAEADPGCESSHAGHLAEGDPAELGQVLGLVGVVNRPGFEECGNHLLLPVPPVRGRQQAKHPPVAILEHAHTAPPAPAGRHRASRWPAARTFACCLAVSATNAFRPVSVRR